jgi:protein gp37
MSRSGIEYIDEAWNVTTGCTPVSAGCANCWARRRIEGRLRNLPRYKDGFAVTLHPDRLDEPLRWRKPRVVGVSFMGDLFHPDVPHEFIARVWMKMLHAEDHIFLLLTKRVARAKESLDAITYLDLVLPNVWLGVSVEDQATADERIPILLATPAAHRWVSVEPMLGPVDLTGGSIWGGAFEVEDGVEQVIVGCESGPKRRPMDAAWTFDIHEQCVAAGVPIYIKQTPSTPEGYGKVIHYKPRRRELAWRVE